MATAGNSTVADAAYEGRGARAGVQFRKRHMRKAPYDRPTTARGNQQRYGWLSKVVDPASKIITSAANRIFGSVFRKCHIPTTEHSPGQITRDSKDSRPDQLPLTANYSALCQQGNSREIRNLDTSFNGNRVAELKPMLKKEKLTRSDGALGDKKEKCEVKAEGPGHENWAKQREFAIGARDLRDDDASRPAGLIKVHTSAKASPNLSPAPKAVLKRRISILQSDIGTVGPIRRIRRKLNLLSSKNLALPTACPSLMVQGAGTASADQHIHGTHPSISSKKSAENAQFNEPEKLEKPYPRQGDTCELIDSRLGTLYDLSEPTRTASSACPPKKSQALKRRSELESDIAPIRRIRRKPTLLYSKDLGLPASGASAVSQRQSALSDGREEVASETPETLAPLENKLHTVEDGGAIVMTSGLLPGQALSGLEKVNSLDGSVGGQEGSNLSEATSHHVPSSTYNSRQDTDADKAAEEELTSSSKSDTEHGSNVRLANGDPKPSDKTVANEDLLPSDKTVPSKASIATLDAPEKRPAFQMSAQEDYLELDDDLQPNEIETDFTFPVLPPIPDFTFPIFLASSVVSAGVQPAAVASESIPEVSNIPSLKEASIATLDAPEKRSAFQMSAQEDYLELDDDLQPNEIETDFTFPILPPIPDFTFPIFPASSVVSAGVQPSAISSESIPEVSNIPSLKEAEAAGKASPIADQTSSAGIAPSNVGSGIFSLGSTSSVGDIKQQACNASEPAVCTLFVPATQIMPSILATSASIPAVGSSVSSIAISASSKFCSFSASCPVHVSSPSDTSLTSDSGSFVFSSFPASSPTLVSSPSSSSKSSSLAQPVSSSNGIASGIFGSSCQPAIGTSIGLGFNSSSQPTDFTFGACSGSSASSNSTPSQSSGCLFSASFGPGPAGNSAQTNSDGFTFGLSSCSGCANNSVPMVFVFGSFAASSPTLVSLSSPSSSSKSSLLAQSVSSSNGIASGTFGSSCQPTIGTSVGFGFNSSSQPTDFTFGAYSGSSASTPSQSSGCVFGASFGPGPAGNSAQTNSDGFTFGLSSCSGSANNSVPMVFGSTGSSSGSIFSFTPSLSTSTPTFASATPSASQPGFGSSSGAFAFDSPDPMIIEDSMAVDLVQASTPMPQWPKTSLLFPTVAFGGPPEDSMAVDLVQASIPMLPPSTACFSFSTVASACPAEDSMVVDSVQGSTPPRQVFGLSPMLQPSTTGLVCPADDLMNMDDSTAEDSVMTSTPGRLFAQSTSPFAFPTDESPFQFEALQQCCERIKRTKWRQDAGDGGYWDKRKHIQPVLHFLSSFPEAAHNPHLPLTSINKSSKLGMKFIC